MQGSQRVGWHVTLVHAMPHVSHVFSRVGHSRVHAIPQVLHVRSRVGHSMVHAIPQVSQRVSHRVGQVSHVRAHVSHCVTHVSQRVRHVMHVSSRVMQVRGLHVSAHVNGRQTVRSRVSGPHTKQRVSAVGNPIGRASCRERVSECV